MASANPAPPLRQEGHSAVPSTNAQQQPEDDLTCWFEGSAFLSHAPSDDALFINIFLPSSTKCITFKVPNYTARVAFACEALHSALLIHFNIDLTGDDRSLDMSDYKSISTAVREGVTTALDELKLNETVSLRSLRDAYWAGLTEVIVKATPYAGVEPHIRDKMFEDNLTAAVANASGLNFTQKCNYELLISSLKLDKAMYDEMWNAQLRFRDNELARGVGTVHPQTIINTTVRTVASDEDTRAGLWESFRRAGLMAAEVQDQAGADRVAALVSDASRALRLFDEGAWDDDDNDMDVDVEGDGGNGAEEEASEGEDDDDNDAGAASASVAPGPSNAVSAGPVVARWDFVAGDTHPWRCLTCSSDEKAHYRGIQHKSSLKRHFDMTHGLPNVQIP